MMSKKMKGVILDGTPPYGVSVFDDAKAKLKHKALLQDFLELQKEVQVTGSKLEDAKWRKRVLVAEVRFLRQRHKYLSKVKSKDSLQLQESVCPPDVVNHGKNLPREKTFASKNSALHKLPPLPEPKPKRKSYSRKDATQRVSSPIIDLNHKHTARGVKETSRHPLNPVPDMNHRVRAKNAKDTAVQRAAPIFDLNLMERIQSANDALPRNLNTTFDLNQDNEASLPIRAPIFDLNEISTGEDELQGGYEPLKFDEAKKGLIRGIIEEQQQNDLKLSVCRNAGEGSSRVGKRKISWQDPVALRV